MGRIDAEMKAYMENSAHFADAFNYLIYNGEPVIQPSELMPLDTTELVIPYGNDAREPKQKYRDVLKLWHVMRDANAVYAVLGTENQSFVHYAMPVRCALYDYLNYADQVEQAGKSYRKGNRDADLSGERLSGGEFLSGFRKEDRLLPVVTLVIYFGTSEWDGPTSLHEMLRPVDRNLLRLIPDYHLNLIAPSRMEKADFLKFRTDLGKVLEYIKWAEDRKKLDELVRRDDRYKRVEPESAELINAVTGSELQLMKQEEKIDMCKAIEDMRKEAREEALREASKAMEEREKKVREEASKAMEEREKKAREEALREASKALEYIKNEALGEVPGKVSKAGDDKEKEIYEDGYWECYRKVCKILEDLKIEI